MRSVVVTGASTGIGRAVVDDLVRARFHVWPTVRREEDADDLREAHGDAVTPLLLDVTDDDQVHGAAEQVRAHGPLHGLVNNAGVALAGPLEHLPLDVFRRQLDINLTGQLAVTQAMLPALRAGHDRYGDARVVMMGSIGGRIAGPMLGAYHAGKFALAAVAGTLRAELAPSGITVVLVEPGAIATPIWARGIDGGEEVWQRLPAEGRERYQAQKDQAVANARRSARTGLPPERVARVVTRALLAPNPRPRLVVGRDAALAAAMVRLLPHRAIYRITAART